MNPLLDNLRKQNKNLKLFKQLIKRESQALRQFLNETILISRQYDSTLFDGIHYYLSKFQSDLQNQYVLLKQLGKQSQEVKQDAQTCFQNKYQYLKSDIDQTNIETDIETRKKEDYQMIRINDIILKEKQMIKKTNQIIQIFTQKHGLTIQNSFQWNQCDCKQSFNQISSCVKQKAKAVILSNQTIESITMSSVDEKESIQELDSSFENQFKKERQLHQFLDDQLITKQF